MKLTFICPVFDASGYAHVARSIIFGLLERGFLIRILPSNGNKLDAGLPPAQRERLQTLCQSNILPEGPIVQIGLVQNFLLFPNRINIGMTMLESDHVPAHWVETCNRMDQIWVPSTFNQTTFVKSGVRPEKVAVVPIGVDVNRFHPRVAPLKVGPFENRLVFLSNFEWVIRKGYDLLLQAYLEEFSQSDPVALVIKTYEGSHFDPSGKKMRAVWKEMIQRYGIRRPPLLEWITDGIADEDMPSFYTAGDCYIIPSRGEGWNLPALEAMSCGIPVITTNWSAHVDFVQEQTGYLIRVEGFEPIPQSGSPNDQIYRGARWAVPSLSDLRERMRHALEHPDEIREKGKCAREHAVRYWSTSNMIERIEALLGAVGG
ncbi:glycosyltransferase family 4 protein [Brevibacillus humidisoli]|uniref:glycosyltransferase family 4 protein n=1 Tax=Brevibacillus humidisoli TaxID=2895522 RepID=UPI001E52A92A|nr:glycosyltransferase family 4 protein [Brevibacillus humidisoli]UFJ42517.1 glycosyltransferase family 4 protein [Brevibacillus humidisoli]